MRQELLARIRAMTRAATAIDATTLSVGNVRLDTAACTLVGPEARSIWPIASFSLWSSLCATPVRACLPSA